MKGAVLLSLLIMITGCAVKKVGSMGTRIGKSAVAQVQTEQQVRFTRGARNEVIMKTDAFVGPRLEQADHNPQLEQELSDQTSAALDKHVHVLKTVIPGVQKIDAQDIASYRPEVQEYRGLILSSEPSPADVYLRISDRTWYQGPTTMRKVFPVDSYTFQLKRDHCKDTEIIVPLERGENPVSMTVRLDCQ